MTSKAVFEDNKEVKILPQKNKSPMQYIHIKLPHIKKYIKKINTDHHILNV
jgi:hypothetical protein